MKTTTKLMTGLLVLCATTTNSYSAISITAIGGTLEGGVIDELMYYVDGATHPRMTFYGNSGTQDIISNINGNDPIIISVTAADTIAFSRISFRWQLDPTKTNSEVTLTGLNSQGDNWVGFSTNTYNAATFVDSDTIVVDLAVIKAQGGDTNGASFTLTTVAVPEPSSIALLGLGGLALMFRRRR